MENFDNLLEITVTHNDQRIVSYRKWDDISVKIDIKNISNTDIGIPLDHIKEIGGILSLYDKKTEKSSGPWAGLAQIKNYTTLHPGEHVKIEDGLRSNEVEYFNQIYVDLDLNVFIATKIFVNGQYREIQMSDTIPVIDIEKPPTNHQY